MNCRICGCRRFVSHIGSAYDRQTHRFFLLYDEHCCPPAIRFWITYTSAEGILHTCNWRASQATNKHLVMCAMPMCRRETDGSCITHNDDGCFRADAVIFYWYLEVFFGSLICMHGTCVSPKWQIFWERLSAHLGGLSFCIRSFNSCSVNYHLRARLDLLLRTATERGGERESDHLVAGHFDIKIDLRSRANIFHDKQKHVSISVDWHFLFYTPKQWAGNIDWQAYHLSFNSWKRVFSISILLMKNNVHIKMCYQRYSFDCTFPRGPRNDDIRHHSRIKCWPSNII